MILLALARPCGDRPAEKGGVLVVMGPTGARDLAQRGKSSPFFFSWVAM
jgi:hypothetical protein